MLGLAVFALLITFAATREILAFEAFVFIPSWVNTPQLAAVGMFLFRISTQAADPVFDHVCGNTEDGRIRAQKTLSTRRPLQTFHEMEVKAHLPDCSFNPEFILEFLSGLVFDSPAGHCDGCCRVCCGLFGHCAIANELKIKKNEERWGYFISSSSFPIFSILSIAKSSSSLVCSAVIIVLILALSRATIGKTIGSA